LLAGAAFLADLAGADFLAGAAFLAAAFLAGAAFLAAAFFAGAAFPRGADEALFAFVVEPPFALALSDVFFVTVPAPFVDADLARAIATSRPGRPGKPLGPRISVAHDRRSSCAWEYRVAPLGDFPSLGGSAPQPMSQGDDRVQAFSTPPRSHANTRLHPHLPQEGLRADLHREARRLDRALRPLRARLLVRRRLAHDLRRVARQARPLRRRRGLGGDPPRLRRGHGPRGRHRRGLHA